MTVLYYVHDPMCSWCWGFRPVWETIRGKLDARLLIRPVLGGLAADSDEPMPAGQRATIQTTWKRIQDEIPGTRFNFDFWTHNTPRRSTYTACRAVIAARQQHPGKEDAMILAIQRAYYLDAQNPSDSGVLVKAASDIGLDTARFSADIVSGGVQKTLSEEIALAAELGATAFPCLVCETPTGRWPVLIDYNDPGRILDQVEGTLASPPAEHLRS